MKTGEFLSSPEDARTIGEVRRLVQRTPKPVSEVQINPRALPKSVSPTVANALVNRVHRASQQAEAKRAAEDRKQMDRLIAESAPESAAARKALVTAPSLVAYQKEVDALISRKDLRPDRLHAALVALEMKHRPVMDEVLRKANVRLPAVQDKINRVVPEFRIPVKSIVDQIKVVPPIFQLPNAQSTEIVVTKPFVLKATEISDAGLSFGHIATADVNTGICTSQVKVFTGLAKGKVSSAVGHILSVPAGVKRMDVQAQYSYSFFADVISVLTISVARVFSFLEVFGTDGVQHEKSVELGRAIGAVLSGQHNSGAEGPVFLALSVPVPPGGGTFSIRLRFLATAAIGGVGGKVHAFIQGTCEKFVIRMVE
jgi:hypothetical protein